MANNGEDWCPGSGLLFCSAGTNSVPAFAFTATYQLPGPNPSRLYKTANHHSGGTAADLHGLPKLRPFATVRGTHTC